MFHFCQWCIPRHTCTQSNYIQYTLTKVQLLPPAVGWYASLTFIASLLRMLFWSLIHLNNVISHWQTKITKFAYIALHTEDTKQYKTRIVNGHGYMPLELSMYEVWACVCVCVLWKCVSVCVCVCSLQWGTRRALHLAAAVTESILLGLFAHVHGVLMKSWSVYSIWIL